ncbi:MAG: sensor histidine kinase [Rhodocyclaceae bacterium]|nr:sensor histidine kinase [Rhodocyclaceae bacterium]
MLQGWVIVLASLAYLTALFAVAYWGDWRAEQGRSIIANPYIYTLSIAVYCTTWTYYGSVGRAAGSGIGFLPIYLGPTLVFSLWWLVMLKMLRISKTYRITSIADFVASRYGKSQLLGGLVTIIAVIGVVPYIALQLKAVSNSFTILLNYPDIVMPAKVGAGLFLEDNTLYIALLLAAFTILFGTRHLDATERHEGMVAAIAMDSVLKLVAFTAIGLFVTYGLYDGFGDIFRRAQAVPALKELMNVVPGGGQRGSSWLSLTILSMLAVMLLPRQFQVGVVENVNENHLRKAIWLFPLYLLAINLFVLPIAFGGMLSFPGGDVDADTFVLALPMAHKQEGLALLAFLGGLSAATGMVIVETIALSTMVCNDLAMPFLLNRRWEWLNQQKDLSEILLTIRRSAIAAILLLGYAYFRLAGEAYALVGIGLISFTAVAQFAPIVFGGMFWKQGSRNGALAGLLAGFSVWLYTLLLPSFARSGWLPGNFMQGGIFGLELLHPQHLFGLVGLDETTHCLFWSLLANISAYMVVSLMGRPGAAEAGQASLFVDVFQHTQGFAGSRFWRGSADPRELVALTSRFLGPERTQQAFGSYARQRGVSSVGLLQPDADLVHFAETLLAGAIGSASARVMVASVVKEEPLGLDEVMNILDEASQVRAYSRQLERKSRELEEATQELREANERLRELDRMKDEFLSTVSHELRTPLTSIRAFSEILLQSPDMSVIDRQNFLGIITKETERLTRLINQVLDMAKLESGRTEWRMERLDVRQVIEEAIAAASSLFSDRQVSLETRLAGAVAEVEADRDKLIQVLLNLLSNAVKFVPSGSGEVAVYLLTERDGAKNSVRVEVRDNGPGIPREDQGMIFEKFRQGGDSLTGKPQGTGLGLPISRQIMEHFGGRLWVDSEPGEGACFILELPRADTGDNGRNEKTKTEEEDE